MTRQASPYAAAEDPRTVTLSVQSWVGAQADVVGHQEYKGWNKTHLLGAQIGGSNKDTRDFVAMHRNANSPVMKARPRPVTSLS